MAALPAYDPLRAGAYALREMHKLPVAQFIALKVILERCGENDPVGFDQAMERFYRGMEEANVSRAPPANVRGPFRRTVLTNLLVNSDTTENQEVNNFINRTSSAARRAPMVGAPPGVGFKYSEIEFSKLKFPSREGFDARNEKAHLWCRAEYSRAFATECQSRLNFITAGAAGNNAAVLADGAARPADVNFENMEIILPGAAGGRKATLPLHAAQSLVWMMTFDKTGMPLNPMAVSLLTSQQVYVRYAIFALPKDISDLLLGWIDHVSKVANGRFADMMAVLKNENSTVEEVFFAQSTPGSAEVVAVVLALQYSIYKAVEISDSQPAAIASDVYWAQLQTVDSLARRFKQLLFRNTTSPVELLNAPPVFENKDLHVFACADAIHNNPSVKTFVQTLPNIYREQQAGQRRGGRAGDGPVQGPAAPPGPGGAAEVREKHCNYCSVKTKDHSGHNCPWRNKKTRAELKKMTSAEKLAGPPA